MVRAKAPLTSAGGMVLPPLQSEGQNGPTGKPLFPFTIVDIRGGDLLLLPSTYAGPHISFIATNPLPQRVMGPGHADFLGLRGWLPCLPLPRPPRPALPARPSPLPHPPTLCPAPASAPPALTTTHPLPPPPYPVICTF